MSSSDNSSNSSSNSSKRRGRPPMSDQPMVYQLHLSLRSPLARDLLDTMATDTGVPMYLLATQAVKEYATRLGYYHSEVQS